MILKKSQSYGEKKDEKNEDMLYKKYVRASNTNKYEKKDVTMITYPTFIVSDNLVNT